MYLIQTWINHSINCIFIINTVYPISKLCIWFKYDSIIQLIVLFILLQLKQYTHLLNHSLLQLKQCLIPSWIIHSTECNNIIIAIYPFVNYIFDSTVNHSFYRLYYYNQNNICYPFDSNMNHLFYWLYRYNQNNIYYPFDSNMNHLFYWLYRYNQYNIFIYKIAVWFQYESITQLLPIWINTIYFLWISQL